MTKSNFFKLKAILLATTVFSIIYLFIHSISNVNVSNFISSLIFFSSGVYCYAHFVQKNKIIF